METKSIYDLHAEHQEWLNKLKFYEDELKIMQDRVSEIALKYSDKKVLAQVDHFQNQIIIQKEQIDIMGHNIRENEALLQKNINDNPVAVDHRKMEDDIKNRDAVETIDKIFNDLRHEFNTFLSKVM